MRSIRNQLVLLLVSGTLLLTSAAGIGLYSYMDEVLERGLDAALAAKSEAIIAAVHMEDDGKPHLQQDGSLASPTNRHEGPFYFQIRHDDGTMLTQFVPPGTGDLPSLDLKRTRRRFQDAELSDGTWTRITQVAFLAHADEDEFDSPHQAATFPQAHLVLVVAHDRRSIDGPLAVLLTGLLLAAALVAVGILIIVTWGVRRGLRPLADLSALADRIGPDTLEVRFPGREKLPPELLPIGQKLNELLDRLTAAFSRERRFSAAVAHELRTPLAELRSACDVALAWPEDSQGLATAVSESRDIALQMSTLVQALLSLARQHAGIGPSLNSESVNLALLIAEVLSALKSTRTQQQIPIQQDLDPNAVVVTDRTLLRVVLFNLLENALEYTPPEGRIIIRIDAASSDEWMLHIANTCTDLNPLELPQLFEPFWRADSARTGNTHTGLGLTLVQAYCQAIGIQVVAALVSENMVEFTLKIPQSTRLPIN